MDEEEALDLVTEVTVSASEKKQLDRYEPAEAHVSYTAAVPEGVDASEVQEALTERAQSEAKRNVLRRWEEYLRKQDDDE